MRKGKQNELSDSQLDERLGLPEEMPDGLPVGIPADAAADRMAHARAARANAVKNGVRREPNLLYVVECDRDGKLGRIVKAFGNKYRLAKWLAVAADIDPSLPGRVAVIRGKQRTLSETIE